MSDLIQTPSMFASDHVPNIEERSFELIDDRRLFDPPRAQHRPRILLLYGSLRERSYSRLLSEEAGRILRRYGVETRTFRPSGPQTNCRSWSCLQATACPAVVSLRHTG